MLGCGMLGLVFATGRYRVREYAARGQAFLDLVIIRGNSVFLRLREAR